MRCLAQSQKINGFGVVKIMRFEFFIKFFIWAYAPPIGDLGGSGPSLGVLKRLSQILLSLSSFTLVFIAVHYAVFNEFGRNRYDVQIFLGNTNDQ